MVNELFLLWSEHFTKRWSVMDGHNVLPEERGEGEVFSNGWTIKETDSDFIIRRKQWGTTIFYSKKDRYIIMQLRELDK